MMTGKREHRENIPGETLRNPMSGFDFHASADTQLPSTVEDTLRSSTIEYLQCQLGWPTQACEQRLAAESALVIPKRLFDELSRQGWKICRTRLLDVGTGQGGALLEALSRDADAVGVEPGKNFRTVARTRLEAAGFEAARVLPATGQALPFPDNHFDYVISLQVLEHVPDPGQVMKEIFRVLKPGGQCYISCENYLAFREQHYRVPWLPMLPKPIGAFYLRLIGRDPAFLRDFTYYTTYPQIWRLAREIGFENRTYAGFLVSLEDIASIQRAPARIVCRALRLFPKQARQRLLLAFLHLNALLRVGTRVRLSKPTCT